MRLQAEQASQKAIGRVEIAIEARNRAREALIR